MITVSIYINGNAIFTRSAVNSGKEKNGYHQYILDDGSTLLHKRNDKAVKLAKKMLDTIKEV